MIPKDTWQEVINAVADPKSVRKGASRRRFRAAVELTVEMVCNTIVGSASRSPEQMALALNRWLGEHLTHKFRALAKAVVAVIDEYNVLQSGGYEDVGNFEGFVCGPIMEMINLIHV